MSTDKAATEAFRDDPIGFLANAMILAPSQNALRANRSEHLGLALLGNSEPVTGLYIARAGSANGPQIPIYQVTKATEGEPYFRSYIADYAQGKTTFTTLGTNQHATFCFTANMNGCTFGIGSQGSAGDALLVSHGNAANATGISNIPGGLQGGTRTALQTAIQYTRAKEGHGVGGAVFEPEHYRIGQRQSVTFGHRRRGQKWTFYSLTYERTGAGFTPVYISHGVNPMATNQITA